MSDEGRQSLPRPPGPNEAAIAVARLAAKRLPSYEHRAATSGKVNEPENQPYRKTYIHSADCLDALSRGIDEFRAHIRRNAERNARLLDLEAFSAAPPTP